MSTEIKSVDNLGRGDFGDFEFIKGYKAWENTLPLSIAAACIPFWGFAAWKQLDLHRLASEVTRDAVVPGACQPFLLIAISILLFLFVRYLLRRAFQRQVLLFREGIIVSTRKKTYEMDSMYFEENVLQPWGRIKRITRYPGPAGFLLLEGPPGSEPLMISPLFKDIIDDLITSVREQSAGSTVPYVDLNADEGKNVVFGDSSLTPGRWTLFDLLPPFVICLTLLEGLKLAVALLALDSVVLATGTYLLVGVIIFATILKMKNPMRVDVGEHGILVAKSDVTRFFPWVEIEEIKQVSSGGYRIRPADCHFDIQKERIAKFDETIVKYMKGREPIKPIIRAL